MVNSPLKISIVTPSFNQAEFLEECIDSVLSQNYPNLEYIIMDGGSSDNSVEIIKKYEKYLAFWQSRADGGHYFAVNEGFLQSSGEIMGWLNSDDMFHPGGLFILDDVFQQRQDIQVLTGRRVGFNADGQLNSYGLEKQTWSRESLLDRRMVDKFSFIMQESTYWRRNIWQKAGATLDISYKLAADFELWLRFSRFSQIHTVDALIAGFRSYGASQRSQLMLNEYLEECYMAIPIESAQVRQTSIPYNIAPECISYPVGRTYSRHYKKSPPPKISIVTPSFNQGEFLEECIDSVLSQNYTNLEYIIMDGGSSDNSVEIIKKYEKYLTYWQSRADGGQYAAIEDGFKRSTGDVMAWLNSDDKYHHNALYKVAYTFSTFRHIEWVVGRPTFWDGNGDVSHVDVSLHSYCREKILQKDYNNPYIQQESSFWRRSLWDKSGGYLLKTLEYAGDLELWLRFFRFAELHTVDAILGGYRKHGNQKAALCIDKYMAEADAILNVEIELFNSSKFLRCSAPPPILMVTADEIAKYIDTVCEESGMKPFRYGDESDKVMTCLLRQLEKFEVLAAELESVHQSFGWRINKLLRWLSGSKLK